MRLAYVLLSPTWGMHQYTAGLANDLTAAGHEVHLITTRGAPADRYAPAVTLHTDFTTRDRGFSLRGLAATPTAVRSALCRLRALRPDVVHITGAHLGNPLLLRALHRSGVPSIHTLHDLHPHAGSSYGRLLYAWNNWVLRESDHILVHGLCWREELLRRGLAPERVVYSPLTHLFLSAARQTALEAAQPAVTYSRSALFIGRLEAYKGLEVLVEAAARLSEPDVTVTIAGPGRLADWVHSPLPASVDYRPGLVPDDLAESLFSTCGVVVLPYIEASQSALIAAAYFFRKPVIVTRVGALPEYVVEGETGWIAPPNDPVALAEALSAALSDPSRLEQMGRACRSWYDRQRADDKQALLELYRTAESVEKPGERGEHSGTCAW
ncbi:MAG TPA: glycosyltransferase family 4 protein [Anaerolineae bacterium]|nr:glycosyltransferase family 4 protein [Anaerolineae bacterium]